MRVDYGYYENVTLHLSLIFEGIEFRTLLVVYRNIWPVIKVDVYEEIFARKCVETNSIHNVNS